MPEEERDELGFNRAEGIALWRVVTAWSGINPGAAPSDEEIDKLLFNRPDGDYMSIAAQGEMIVVYRMLKRAFKRARE